MSVPEGELAVSLLGEKLTVERIEGPPALLTQPGRPIAVVSNVMLEYRPGPARASINQPMAAPHGSSCLEAPLPLITQSAPS